MATQALKEAVISPLADAIFEQLGYDPTQGGLNEFQPPILRSRAQYILVTGGGQGGKSLGASKKFQENWALDRVNHTDRGDGSKEPHLYWLVGSAYEETRKEFQYIADDLMTLGYEPYLFVSSGVNPGLIELRYKDSQGHPDRKPTLRIETKSGTDVTKMSKESPNGIILCEAAQMQFEVFERARDRVTPSDGWMYISGTMERELGMWFRQLALHWAPGVDGKASFRLPSYSNYAWYPGGRNDPKILRAEQEQSDEWFKERIEGIPVPPKGLVFGEVDASVHVRDSAYNPDLPVYMGEDPGYGSELTHAHALEVYQIAQDYTAAGQPYQQIRGIDEIFQHGTITKDIIEIAMGREWWRSPKFLFSDPHYKDQHHANSSVAEIWIKEAGIVPGPKARIPVMPGIERLKSFLKADPVSKLPKIVFSPKQKGLLSNFGLVPNPLGRAGSEDHGAMRPYRWKTDRQGAVYGQIPDDKDCDAVKATWYFLVDHFGYGYDRRNHQAKITRY